MSNDKQNVLFDECIVYSNDNKCKALALCVLRLLW